MTIDLKPYQTEYRGYDIKAIPVKNEKGQWWLWGITARKKGEDEALHIELQCRDIKVVKLHSIMKVLVAEKNNLNKIKKYVNKRKPFKKCDVFKMKLTEEGFYEWMYDKSKGAKLPYLYSPQINYQK